MSNITYLMTNSNTSNLSDLARKAVSDLLEFNLPSYCQEGPNWATAKYVRVKGPLVNGTILAVKLTEN